MSNWIVSVSVYSPKVVISSFVEEHIATISSGDRSLIRVEIVLNWLGANAVW